MIFSSGLRKEIAKCPGCFLALEITAVEFPVPECIHNGRLDCSTMVRGDMSKVGLDTEQGKGKTILHITPTAR